MHANFFIPPTREELQNYINGCALGIWGLGTTGRAALEYFSLHQCNLHVFDDKQSQEAVKTQCEPFSVTLHTNIRSFLGSIDAVYKSPGVSLENIPHNIAKRIAYIPEFSHFMSVWNKPTIAITGSIGKTTVTTSMAQLLHHAGIPVAMGGNIGTPLIALLPSHHATHAVLELSSFQLEHGELYGPDLAIISNIYPNHLDRHKTFAAYICAKLNLLAQQHTAQYALVPLTCKPYIVQYLPSRTARTAYISPTRVGEDMLNTTFQEDTIYYLDKGIVHKWSHASLTCLPTPSAHTLRYEENMLMLCAALDILSIQPPSHAWTQLHTPAHRCEYVRTYRTIKFYNDSKSSVIESTQAAVGSFTGSPLVLFLGGLSKGVCRQPLVKSLRNQVRYIVCFGAEAERLAAWCAQEHIPASIHQTLDEAFIHYVQYVAQAHDIALLSPAGTSYDLFKNYEERGNRFKALIHELP